MLSIFDSFIKSLKRTRMMLSIFNIIKKRAPPIPLGGKIFGSDSRDKLCEEGWELRAVSELDFKALMSFDRIGLSRHPSTNQQSAGMMIPVII